MGHKRPKFKKETGHFALTKNTYHERIDLVLKTDDISQKLYVCQNLVEIDQVVFSSVLLTSKKRL